MNMDLTPEEMQRRRDAQAAYDAERATRWSEICATEQAERRSLREVGVVVHTSRTGKRFAYIGDRTIRERRDGSAYDVTAEIDGDEVLIATGRTWREAVRLAA